MKYPDWLRLNPIVNPETSHKSYLMMDEVAKENILDFIDMTPYDWFVNIISTVYSSNMIDSSNCTDTTEYPDSFTHEEVIKSVMWGNTSTNNLFVIIKFDVGGELVMTTFYEKQPYVWIPSGKQMSLFQIDNNLSDNHLSLIVNVLTGRSIIPEKKHDINEKYQGKTIKLWDSNIINELKPGLESLPDERRIPKVDEIITFSLGEEFPDDEYPIRRTISTYGDIVISPDDSKYWKVCYVDPNGNCMNVKGSKVHNSNAEKNHTVPQIYIHVFPVKQSDEIKEYYKRMKKYNPDSELKCYWFIDFTNGYIRQWEDAAITHSIHDLKVISDFTP
jgi:hypothetical protein